MGLSNAKELLYNYRPCQFILWKLIWKLERRHNIYNYNSPKMAWLLGAKGVAPLLMP